jgi:hypothetical protein
MRILVLLLATAALAAQDAPAARRAAYEGVIHFKGKTIGTTILLEIHGERVLGWIQKHDFFPIDSGSVTPTGYTFTAAGNTYQINSRTSRIQYGGADGSGDQRIIKMESVTGWVYRLTEEADDMRTMTLRLPNDEIDLNIGRPSVWKRSGTPIRHLEWMEQIVGKTVTFWRVRTGGAWTIEVIEEPEGLDLLARQPSEKEKKREAAKKGKSLP